MHSKKLIEEFENYLKNNYKSIEPLQGDDLPAVILGSDEFAYNYGSKELILKHKRFKQNNSFKLGGGDVPKNILWLALHPKNGGYSITFGTQGSPFDETKYPFLKKGIISGIPVSFKMKNGKIPKEFIFN